MEFTRIQDARTHEITQYRLDGKRVSIGRFLGEEARQKQQNKLKYQYMSSSTTRTPKGNYKHTFYTNI